MLAFAMPGGISREEVEAIARLANLDLSTDEVELFSRQLGEILEYVNHLQAIVTTGVPPTASVASRHDIDRDDRLIQSLDRASALANAPDAASDAGLFKVPRVIG